MLYRKTGIRAFVMLVDELFQYLSVSQLQPKFPSSKCASLLEHLDTVRLPKLGKALSQSQVRVLNRGPAPLDCSHKGEMQLPGLCFMSGSLREVVWEPDTAVRCGTSSSGFTNIVTSLSYNLIKIKKIYLPTNVLP